MGKEWAIDTARQENSDDIGASSPQTLTLHQASRSRPFRLAWLDKGNRLIEDRYACLPDSLREDSPFPSTRYYGSKRRQLEWLKSELRMIDGETALDAFGGTGAVSFLLQRLGWQTTYNDIFEFNTVTARALFSNSTKILSNSTLQTFLDGVQPIKGFITSTFEGLYFTTEENMWLDGYMKSLFNEPEQYRDLLLHCLFQACLKKRPFNLFHRANLNLRYSQMPVRFGNRATWNKSFATHIKQTYAELFRVQSQGSLTVHVNASHCASEIAPKFDLIYLDPPYFKKAKRNTETYIERYHFLEGLARYREWESLIDPKSAIRSFRRPYRKEWTNKDDMLLNIRKMIAKHREAAFALSYVAHEEPSEEDLFDLFRDSFNWVRLSRRSFSRSLSKKKTFEILLIGR